MAKQAEYVGRAGTYNLGKLRFEQEKPRVVADDVANKLKEKRDGKGRRLFVISAVDEDAVGKAPGEAVHAEIVRPDFPARGFDSKTAAIDFAKAHFPELMEGDDPLTDKMAKRTLNEILAAAYARKFDTDAIEVGGDGDDFEISNDDAAGGGIELVDDDEATPV